MVNADRADMRCAQFGSLRCFKACLAMHRELPLLQLTQRMGDVLVHAFPLPFRF